MPRFDATVKQKFFFYQSVVRENGQTLTREVTFVKVRVLIST